MLPNGLEWYKESAIKFLRHWWLYGLDMVGPFLPSSLQGFFIELLKISEIFSDKVARVDSKLFPTSWMSVGKYYLWSSL
jgi:hypothetical protein